MAINILDLVTYFIVYSFLGWIMESIYSSIREKRLINRGFLHGPFCPIYGTGAIIMYIFLQNFSENPILVFCLGFVVLSVWEYIVGYLLEKTLHTKYWDYSKYKYNIHGRVCLLNSVFWGILAVVFISFVHPIVMNVIANIDKKVLFYADLIILVFFSIDAIISLLEVVKIDKRLEKLEEINKAIKEKLSEVKLSKEKEEQSNTEKLKKMIEELNNNKIKLKRTMYRTVVRIKKAFPDVDSEKVSKILNYKINLKSKKKSE